MDNNDASPLQVRPFQPEPSRPRPQNPEFLTWVKNFSKLSVEVGCGVGYHPLQWAKDHPDEGIIAIERTQTKYRKFLRRFESHESPKNVFPVYGDGRLWLPTHLKTATVDRYHFIYPNPYPKKAQANKRWHRNPLMHFVLETLKRNGEIYFATNELWLYEECRLFMTKFWKLSVLSDTTVVFPQPRYLSHFEKKYLERGQTGYHLVFKKSVG